MSHEKARLVSGMEIPIDRLSPETLARVVEQFVLREGTDYGQREFALEDKVAAVVRQLHKGQAVLVYDQETESCNVVSRVAWQEMQAEVPKEECSE